MDLQGFKVLRYGLVICPESYISRGLERMFSLLK